MPDDFLQLAGKNVLVMGVANRRSVAFHTARMLEAAGARVVCSVRSDERREQVRALVGDVPIVVCDVEREEEVAALFGRKPGPARKAKRKTRRNTRARK